MTTPNTAVETAVTAATVTRVTFKSALLAGDVKGLAAILADLGTDKAGVQKLGLTFSLAVKDAQEVLKARQKELDEQAANIQKEKENMITFLTDTINGMGMDLEAAEYSAQVAIDKKYNIAPAAKKKFTFNRVAVNVGGKVYEMQTSGNVIQVLKDAMKATGLTTHKEFILAHAVDKEAAAAAFAE